MKGSGARRLRPPAAVCAAVTAISVLRVPLTAQEPRREPVLPQAVLTELANEVDGQAAYRVLGISSTYHRMLGSDEMSELMRRLEATVRGYGIEDVTIRRVPVRTGRESFWLQNFGGQVPASTNHAELRLVQPYPKLIASTDGVPSLVVQGSRAADVTAPVVFVGHGTAAADYEGKDVKGKLVLAGNAPIDAIKETAIHREGAAGVLYYRDTPSYSGSDPDANLGLWWWPWSEQGQPSTFAFSLSTNEFRFLKALLDRGAPVVAHAQLDSVIKTGPDAAFETLDFAIPGRVHPDQELWILAHVDHPYPGAVDNASGMATVLETARTLASLIRTGVFAAPQRTIRFLLVPHVAGLSMYLSQHPEKLGHVQGAIVIDGVGVDQSLFSSYLAVYKPSQALASFWPAVLESLVAHLAARTNRDPMDWDNQDNLFAPGGSRDQYHVRLERYTGGGDEFQLNQGNVGIPATAIGTVPVPPRHSQLNTLKWIDSTGLKRAAYLTAALATTFGWSDTSSAWRLIDETYDRGREHLSRAMALASTTLAEAAPEDRAEARRRGDSLIEQIGKRETENLASIAALFPGDRSVVGLLDSRRSSISSATVALQTELGTDHARLCAGSGCAPTLAPLTPEERRLSGIVPAPALGVHGTTAYFGDYLVTKLGREKLAAYKLRPGFDYSLVGYAEARNFVDGHRSILDIYQAVEAELWSEGYPPAQQMTLDETARYMDMLEAAGLITSARR